MLQGKIAHWFLTGRVHRRVMTHFLKETLLHFEGPPLPRVSTIIKWLRFIGNYDFYAAMFCCSLSSGFLSTNGPGSLRFLMVQQVSRQVPTSSIVWNDLIIATNHLFGLTFSVNIWAILGEIHFPLRFLGFHNGNVIPTQVFDMFDL